jgi:hypothetical protein
MSAGISHSVEEFKTELAVDVESITKETLDAVIENSS